MRLRCSHPTITLLQDRSWCSPCRRGSLLNLQRTKKARSSNGYHRTERGLLCMLNQLVLNHSSLNGVKLNSGSRWLLELLDRS